MASRHSPCWIRIGSRERRNSATLVGLVNSGTVSLDRQAAVLTFCPESPRFGAWTNPGSKSISLPCSKPSRWRCGERFRHLRAELAIGMGRQSGKSVVAGKRPSSCCSGVGGGALMAMPPVEGASPVNEETGGTDLREQPCVVYFCTSSSTGSWEHRDESAGSASRMGRETNQGAIVIEFDESLLYYVVMFSEQETGYAGRSHFPFAPRKAACATCPRGLGLGRTSSAWRSLMRACPLGRLPGDKSVPLSPVCSRSGEVVRRDFCDRERRPPGAGSCRRGADARFFDARRPGENPDNLPAMFYPRIATGAMVAVLVSPQYWQQQILKDQIDDTLSC